MSPTHSVLDAQKLFLSPGNNCILKPTLTDTDSDSCSLTVRGTCAPHLLLPRLGLVTSPSIPGNKASDYTLGLCSSWNRILGLILSPNEESKT